MDARAIVVAAAAALAAYVLILRRQNQKLSAREPQAALKDAALQPPTCGSPAEAPTAPASVPPRDGAVPTVAGSTSADLQDSTCASAAAPHDSASVSREASTINVAQLATCIAKLLGELRKTFAGSEERRVQVLELHAMLEQATMLPAKSQRTVGRAFADNDGPEICYEIESCMNGDWVADAKNGTMSAISKISRLPGPIGQAFFSYRSVREKMKADAAHGQGCREVHPGQLPMITAPEVMSNGSNP